MKRILPFGNGEVFEFEPAMATVVADFSSPRGVPLDDPAAAVAAVLAAPLGYPPLRDVTIPGDRIVIAVESDVPQSATIVAAVIDWLLAGATTPDQITVLLAAVAAAPTATGDPRVEWQERFDPQIAIEIHAPDQRNELAYLAASKDNKPIYINRRLVDADLVIPVGCLRPSNSLGDLGVHGGLYPTFSDDQTQQRFRAPHSMDDAVHPRLRRAEADEAVWLLGSQFTIQIVPGPGDTILHVLAGEHQCVAEQGAALCDAAWSFHLPQRADLVVATIEGGPRQQTWENFARALFAATSATTRGGTIVLCTALRCSPGPSLQRLAGMDDDEHTLHEIRRDRSPDAIAANLLIETRQRQRIYLLSGLDSETVEELGLGYVAQPGDIHRLSQQHELCILLANAHRAMLTSADN